MRINGPSDESLRLPNTLSISIKGLAAASLLQQLGQVLAASAGAACHSSAGPVVSSVLAAMKVSQGGKGGTWMHAASGAIAHAAKLPLAGYLL